MEKEQLTVGFIRGTHGFSGECKVESASGEYEHIARLKEVTLQNGTNTREVQVESSALACNTMYVKFKGIDSDVDIKKYNGWSIVVPRKFAKPLQKDEWYFEDLRDCSLVYEGDDDPVDDKKTAKQKKSVVVGTITDVLEGGGGYLLEVSLSESCDRKVLIPFRNQFIGKVDVKNGTVQLMHLWILE